MKLTAIVLGISSFSLVLVVITDTATLSLPTRANCGDQAEIICSSTSCRMGYRFFRDNSLIYTVSGHAKGDSRYSATVTSDTQVQLTITNVQLSDVGTYSCGCGFDTDSAWHTLQYQCKATTCSAEISPAKKLSITVDKLYPAPSGSDGIITYLTSWIPGLYTCVSSPTFDSHYKCTWVSTASLPDGDHSYTITVTTGTQAALVFGSFRIVTATSPIISNLVPISNNRQVISGVQDSPLTIQCVSRGGIPAPTLAWYRSSVSTSPLTQSSTNSVQEADGTYTVTLTHRFTPSRTDDIKTFLCRVSYPGATTKDSSDPSSASARLYLVLKPDITTLSQTGEAISGGQMTIRCISTNGRPAPNITWYYRDQTFKPTNAASLDPTSETYAVVSVLERPVIAEDNGQRVTCMVSHSSLDKTLTRTFNVDVKFGPRPDTVIISGNKGVPATGTIQIQLNCTSGSSNPASNITWYNGSDVIPNTGNYRRWPGDNNGMITSTILTITPTRYMDGNRITCRPHNGYGIASSYVDLDIFYSCQIQTLPNVTAIEGEPNVSLTCSASSKPPANFTWYKGNMVLASGMGSLASNRFSYVIPRLDRIYGGSYTCHAGNNVGSLDSKEAYLIVKYPPIVTVSATTPSPYTVTCTAKGYPTEYTYQDWVQIWPGYGRVATIPFDGTTLTLTSDTYERSGVFECAASNGVAVYGTNQTYMTGNGTILIEAPPVLMEPWPGGERVRVIGRLGEDASTRFKYWSNVNDSAVGCYKVMVGNQSSSSGCNVTEIKTEVTLPVYSHLVNETGTLATIKIPIRSHEDFTDYDIVVTNRKGQSVVGITIVSEEPPEAPTIRDINAITTGQVILTVVPGFNGGYNQTLVAQISTDLTTWINKTSVYIGLGNRPTEFILANLKRNLLHYVQMFSYNSAGRSNSSSKIWNFTTAEDASVPDPPTAALIGGTIGTICAVMVVAVIVVVVLRNRKVGLVFVNARDNRCPANEEDNSDCVVECAMYVPAENIQPGPSVRDVYSTPQKKGRPELTDNAYSVVSKRKKDGAAVCAMYVPAENVQPGPSVRDVYSTPQKKGRPELTDNAYSVVSKRKKDGAAVCAMYVPAEKVQPCPSVRDVYSTPQKKGRTELTDNAYSVVAKQKKDLYALPIKRKGSRPVPHVSETEFGHHPTSNRHQISKKNINGDGLIYADLEHDNTANYDVIHGLDDVTIYEEIDFTRTAEPLPESDGESTDTK